MKKHLIVAVLLGFQGLIANAQSTTVVDTSGSTIRVCQVVCTELGCRVVCY